MTQSDYKKIYIQESDELLQQMNAGLLVIEKQPKNSEALNSIFRSAHTLKSMSASMGYRPIADLAHKMEDLLSRIRSQEVKATSNIIDLLFQSFDSLERMVESIQKNEDIKEDVRGLIESLDSHITTTKKFAEVKIDDELSLNIFEKNVLERIESGSFKGYHITVTLDKGCVLKSVRAFMVFRNLHSIGEVIKSIPDMDSIQEEKFSLKFSCVFVSKSSINTIKKNVMEVMEVESVVIKDLTLSQIKDALPAKETALPIQEDAAEHVRKIQSVRVDIERLDKLMNLVEELAINKLRLGEIGNRLGSPDLKGVVDVLSRLTDELQTEVMQARLVPVGQVFDRFPRLVRDLAKTMNKKVHFEILGGDIELDRTVLDEIGDPLIHMLKNAIDHGIEDPSERKKAQKNEEGEIILTARREKSHVFIEVTDDGMGMDAGEIKKRALSLGLITQEALSQMKDEDVFLLTANPGFSTKKEVTEVSGRGVGLDVAKNKAESLGGSLVIESESGKGSKITMRLPITTAVIQALLVNILERVFAIPISNILEIIATNEDEIKKIEHQETLLHRNRVLPLVRLDKLFSSESGVRSSELNHFRTQNSELRTDLTPSSKLNVVVVEFGKNQFGVVVDRLISQQDIVIKQLTKELKGIKGFAGATILGDGRVALVLDVATLI